MTAATPQLLRHVSVLVSGSDASLAAFDYALHLGKAAGGRVEAVIVEETTVPAILAFAHGEILSKFVTERGRLMSAAGDELQRRMTTLARSADVVATITRLSTTLREGLADALGPATLLVIGTSAARNRGELLGASTEYLVRRVRRPVLIAQDPFETPGSVVVAYAAKSLGSLALSTGATLAGVLDVPLEVLIVEEDDDRRRRIESSARETLGDAASSTRFTVEEGNPADVIAGRTGPTTLLVMGAYGRPRAYEFLLGSVTARVLRLAQGPVVLTAKPAPAPRQTGG